MYVSATVITVFIVDGQPVFRDGLRGRLEQQGEFNIVGEEDNGRNAFASCKEHEPRVLLMDPLTPGLDGMQCIAKFKAASPNTNILIASDINELVDVQIALSEGASGYILKNASSEEFINAIRVTASEGSYLPHSLMSGLIEAAQKTKSTGNMFGLTMRELDILRELAVGASNKIIARKLKISVRTVETHRQNIRQKTGVFAITDLVRIANRLGLVKETLLDERV